MSSRYFVPTTIVAGFPAIGKSFIAKKFPILARDLESSDFHWMKDPSTGEWKIDENGNKIAQPEWPANYIETIKALEKSGMYRAVLVSCHQLVRSKMGEANIKYTNIFPQNTPEMKKLILDRCRQRNSPPEFIQNLDAHWDEYIESAQNDPYAVAKIQLTPESIDRWQSLMLMG